MNDEKKTKDQLIDELVKLRQRMTALEALEAAHSRAEEALRQKTAFVHLLQMVAVAANEAATMEEVLQYALDQVCAHTGWPVGDVYLLADDSRAELVPTGIWHLKNPKQFETFRRVTDATSFARGVGLPGRVLASGKPAWIIDVTQDPNFPRAKLAKDIGVKAGFAFPVMVGPDVVAVLEFFSAEAGEMNEPLLDMMSQVGTQLGRVMERTRAEGALQKAHDELENRVEERTAELKEARERLQYLFAVSPAIIYTNQASGDFACTFVSENLHSIMGYRPQEMLDDPKFWASHLHPADAARVFSDVHRLIAQGGGTVEYRFRHRLGHYIWIQDAIKVISDEAGRPVEIVGSWADFTENKRAEEALLAANVELRETRRYLERLIESSTDAIISTDKGGTLVLFNKGAEAMLGYRAEEMIGRRVTVLYESEERAKEVMRQMRKQGGTVSAFETALRAKDGSSIPVLISASTLYDEDGQEAGTVGFNKDLRPLKQAEEELRRAKAQIQALRIEIDQPKRARQVAEITDTEYFQDLQKKAKSLRDRSKTG